MLEMVKTQNHKIESNQVSQPACEVSQFVKNFSEAVQEGNADEIASYFSDDFEPLEFPKNSHWTDETILIDDHVATFRCSVEVGANTELQLTCVLDKSEGYWQIIYGELRNDRQNH